MMKQWIENFSLRRPKDLMCVLVESSSGRLDSYCAAMCKNRINVVKTDDFYNLWPTRVDFLFLQSKAATKALNCSLEAVHTHDDDQLARKRTKCMDALVNPDKTGQGTMCQTVRVVGGTGKENPQERENLHVVMTSLTVDRSEYDRCNSVHARIEVLRCVLFILIDSGIVPLGRVLRTNINGRDVQRKNVVNSVDKSSLWAP